MLTISVEFLHGTFHGASADDTALMGMPGDSGEWPPSPARLFSALVAADGTGSRQRVTDGSELALLEGAPAPAILANPPDCAPHSQLLGRFVVADRFHREPKSGQTGAVQEYVGRTASLVRPGTRRAPSDPRVIYLWRDLSISDDHLWGLKLRAARVGYLGCADSPVRLKVGTDDLASWESLPAWEPDDAGSKVLPVPSVGFLNQLDDAYERWCSGEQVRRAWLTTRFARYRAPGDSVPGVSPPTVLWLRFETPVAGRRVLAVTGALREAVLEGYERGVAGSRALVPPVLHGHGYEGRGFQHAHWLALPHVDSEHADGRIHGAAVWLPPETDGEVVEGVRQVLWHLSTQELAKPGHFRTKVKVFAGERQPWAANPKRWQGPARSWVSAFPVVHERWQAKGPDLDEVGNWCRHAGIATLPAKFRICRVPLAEGALLLSPHEVIRGERRHPYSHIEIVFAAEVIGPVVLGQGRQFGLGLMAPRMDGRLNG